MTNEKSGAVSVHFRYRRNICSLQISISKSQVPGTFVHCIYELTR
jgi:hypothetical protein